MQPAALQAKKLAAKKGSTVVNLQAQLKEIKLESDC
jgi:hypothetical protein